MAKLVPVFVDYETFFSDTHSLTKMSPIRYVMHPETEIISCAAKVGKERTSCTFGEANVVKQFKNFDWSDKFLIAHNNEGFDSMLAAWRCGARPAMWGCTLAMARPHHAKTTGLSLGKLCEHYADELRAMGINPVKDTTVLVNTKGKHLKDFTPSELEGMRAYNILDTEQNAGLFQILLAKTPMEELRIIDMTIRMLVEPKFVVDKALLLKVLGEERERKHLILLDLATMLGVYEPGMDELEITSAVKKSLGSPSKFAKLLHDLGVEAPKKPSPTHPEKQVYALAKTDEAFLDLINYADPLVAAAANARLDVKSTILETRIEAFLEAADAAAGKLPIPTKYYGADTTGRRSGWAYNPLNLPRIIEGKPKPSDALRMSLRVPSGHKVVVADLSGIELRVNHFLWKVPYSTKLWQENPKADLYRAAGALQYNCTPDEVTKIQRQLEKAKALGLGFGLGRPEKFRAAALALAQITIEEDDAARYIAEFRGLHPEIVRGWKTCHAALTAIYSGDTQVIDPWGLCHTGKEGIITPKGVIRYPGLHLEQNDEGKNEWIYGAGRHRARIYAGKVDENIVQHLARTIICDIALDVKKDTGLYPALEVYDELAYVVPEAEAEPLLDLVQRRMRQPPTWWPELVTWSEGDIADCYGEAK